SILTDLDSSILPLPADAKKDTFAEKDCRNSQKSGEDRKKKLDEFINGNDWINVFYAKHTFEVDFLLAGNSYEIIQTIETEFKTDAKKQEIRV
ncbi:ATP-dependent endonuclease, partial [Acinetobacter baumannii]